MWVYGNTVNECLFLPRVLLRRLPEVEFRYYHRGWEKRKERQVRYSKALGM